MVSKDLPKKIAIFPLAGAIFFPNTTLPLNIFEKKYIQLVGDCMKEKKLFGMVQSKLNMTLKSDIYKIGCLGKIVSFDETIDKRFVIALSGIIRFKIKEELKTDKLYREFKVDYTDFKDDLITEKSDFEKPENKILIKKIKMFFDKKNYLIKFHELEKLEFDQMISTVCMISPFSAAEKQKLIETSNTKEKVKTLDEIINFNLLEKFESKTIQ
jgi:uncharacterized protein